MPFKLFFAGGEAPAWRKLLVEEGAKNIAISFTSLKSRLPKTKPYLLSERFPDDVFILVDSGGFGTKTWSPEEHDDHMNAYTKFVEDNLDRIGYVTEYDPSNMSLEWVQSWRTQFWDSLPLTKFMPIWHERYGLGELEEMAAKYDLMGVTTSAKNINARLNGVVARYGVQLHGVAITDPEQMRDVRYTSAMSTGWISPMRFGETIVWDGNHLRRYPARYKEQARRRHRMLFERAGFDPAKILADDGKELARFTVWSWLRLEESMERQRSRRLVRRPSGLDAATISSNGSDPLSAEEEGVGVAVGVVERRNTELMPREEAKVLPVLGFEQRQGTDPTDGSPMTVSVPVLAPTTQRRCNSCYISGSCPEFTPDAACAFSIPVQIRTKDQMMATWTALLEMQMQRVAFARFAEESEGGYPDANLSVELDRFMRMSQQFKDLQDNRDFFRVQVEARGQAGVLSRLFGSEKVQEAAQRLERPLGANEVDTLLSDVVDGEIVS